MSVPLTIGSFKNKEDYDRKLSDYHKLLTLQVKLNKDREKGLVMGELYDMGVKPAPEPYESTERMLENTNNQRNMAIGNAVEMMSKTDAVDFVNKYLPTLSVLKEFNQYWDDFHSTIHTIQGTITPPQLYSLWNRFRKVVYDEMEKPTGGKPKPLPKKKVNGGGLKWNKYVASRQEDKPCGMCQKLWMKQLAEEYKK